MTISEVEGTMKVNYNYTHAKKKSQKRKTTSSLDYSVQQAWWCQNYHYLNNLFFFKHVLILNVSVHLDCTICNFTLYWQFVLCCFSNIKITTTCNFRVNIFPSSPVLAGIIFGFELLSLVFTTVASTAGCQMNCFCKNCRKQAWPARRGRHAQLVQSRLFPSIAASPIRSLSQQDCHQSSQGKDVLCSHSIPSEDSA